MTNVKQAVRTFLDDEEGLTTVEYAVAGALVSLAVVTAFGLLGDQIALTIGALTTAVTAP